MSGCSGGGLALTTGDDEDGAGATGSGSDWQLLQRKRPAIPAASSTITAIFRPVPGLGATGRIDDGGEEGGDLVLIVECRGRPRARDYTRAVVERS
jgi:hypothetical protein